MRKDNRHIDISVVAPCYNEEANIPLFLHRLDKVMHENDIHYEVIIVDDGSVDNSKSLLLDQVEFFSLYPVFLSRNYGQQAALLAGIHKAKGKAIITIDLDLQQPPEVIPQLISRWHQGASVVHSIPVYDHSASWHKRLTSKLFYHFLKVLGSDVVYKANEFSAL